MSGWSGGLTAPPSHPQPQLNHTGHQQNIHFHWVERLIFGILCYFLLLLSNWLYTIIQSEKVKVSVSQSCLTLCDPKDGSPPGSSIHRIFQARIVKWVAISFFRGSSQPRGQTRVSCIAGEFFTV